VGIIFLPTVHLPFVAGYDPVRQTPAQ